MRCAIYVRVSTDEQRDNGYSIDSQLRMIKEYCEKHEYDIVDVYNDAGHSGKDLMRPEMQRLLKDIKTHKIEKIVAIKVDRLTRNNYDGFWFLNYCEEHDVKIELILEPYDVSTANGEMIFGMNLVFGQRERKEIGARTKRAMEEMALEKVHPSKAPYGYTRNPTTGHLQIEPIEAQVVKEIFELCKQGKSTRGIATTMRHNNAYLKTGKWTSDRVYKILTNSIYIGVFEYGKYTRKPQDVLKVENYCEPIIDEETWKITRANLEKNKHPNYGEHIHLFTGIIKCPDCKKILSSTNSYKKIVRKQDQRSESHKCHALRAGESRKINLVFYGNCKCNFLENKNSGTPQAKIYYHLTCKNANCKSKGIHYSSDKIEEKLARVLNELTRYMYDIESEIIICNSTKTKDIKDIDKAIEKLKQQEKKLVDLYLSSTLNVEAINHKNDLIKKEIENLNKKKQQIDPYDELKDYTVELLKKLDCDVENGQVISNNKLAFSFVFNSLNRQSKKDLIKRLIDKIEIKRAKNYDVEITNIKFTEEFISKSSKTYLKYLDEILQNNNVGFIYKEAIDSQELEKLQENYYIFSSRKMENEEYSQADLEKYMALLEEHFYTDGIIQCPYIEDGNVTDHLTLISKNIVEKC